MRKVVDYKIAGIAGIAQASLGSYLIFGAGTYFNNGLGFLDILFLSFGIANLTAGITAIRWASIKLKEHELKEIGYRS